MAVGALREDGRADGLSIGDQRQRDERAHAERLHVGVRHLQRRLGLLDDDRLGVLEQVEHERRLGALAALPAPQVLEVGGGGAVPALLVLLVQRDLAHGRVDQPRQVVRYEGERLVEVDRGRDGAAHVRGQRQLLGVAARLLVEAGGLHRRGDLSGGRTQRLDLAPVRPALMAAVVADLQHAGGVAALIGAERQEDPDEVGVAALLEYLPRERERRLRRVVGLLALAQDAGGNAADHRAVGAHHGHLGPARAPRHVRAPRGNHVHEHVIGRERAVLLKRPARHPPRTTDAGRALRGLDGRRRSGAGRQAHHRALLTFFDEIDGRKVEVELGHRRVGEPADHRLDHLLASRSRPQHRGVHVAERAEQAVAVLEPFDQPLRRERAADQLGPRGQQHVSGRSSTHRSEAVAAHHHEVAVRLAGIAERIGGDRVKVGRRGHARDRGGQRLRPGFVVLADHAVRGGDRGVRGDQLEACAVLAELVDRGGVQLTREEQVGERDRQHAAQLLHIRARLARRLGEHRGEAAQAVEGRALCGGERCLDRLRRLAGQRLELRDALVVGLIGARAVVQIDEAEHGVATQQRQPERGLHLVAADERAVDLRGRIARHEALAAGTLPWAASL